MIRNAVTTCGIALLLAACTQTSAPEPVASTAPRLVTPSSFRLPEGSGCAGEIARFKAVQANDLDTGHVNRGVHEAIAKDVAQAEALCAGGNDAGARASLRATKARYGYPT